MNVENAVAAVALLWVAGFDEAKLREGLETFRGVKRRFDFHINTPELIYMDDYAHHPEELRAALSSVRGMFPGRKITAVSSRTSIHAHGISIAVSPRRSHWRTRCCSSPSIRPVKSLSKAYRPT